MKIWYTVFGNDDGDELFASDKRKDVVEELQSIGLVHAYKNYLNSIEVQGTIDAFRKGFEVSKEE